MPMRTHHYKINLVVVNKLRYFACGTAKPNMRFGVIAEVCQGFDVYLQVVQIALGFVVHYLAAIIAGASSFNNVYQRIMRSFTTLHYRIADAFGIVIGEVDGDRYVVINYGG